MTTFMLPSIIIKMRIKRLKQYKRYMQFYRLTYGFEAPYKFLIDGSFLNTVLNTDIVLRDYLAKIVDDRVHLNMTDCCQ